MCNTLETVGKAGEAGLDPHDQTDLSDTVGFCASEAIDDTGIRAIADVFLLLAEWDAKASEAIR
jgi:hypothetical protein